MDKRKQLYLVCKDVPDGKCGVCPQIFLVLTFLPVTTVRMKKPCSIGQDIRNGSKSDKGSVRDNVWLKSKGKKKTHTNVKRSEMFYGEIALEVDLRE